MALRRAGLEDVGLQDVSVMRPFCQGDHWIVLQRVRRAGTLTSLRAFLFGFRRLPEQLVD